MPNVPLEWLGEYVQLLPGTTASTLAAALVKVGIEEEEIHPPAVQGPLVVGKVLSIVKEEQKNGKTINYCRVDVGDLNDAPGTGKEPSDLPSRGIICGAHNFVEGDYVVVSLPGAVLPGGFAIAARKTYGHVSDGMICSATELGLDGDNGGIIVLTEMMDVADIPAPGSDALDLLGLGTEVLEVNVTPDRGYCFSMRGLAREYSHATGAKFIDPGLAENLPNGVAAVGSQGFQVEIADDSPIHGQVGCDRFVTRVVRGIDPAAQSPKWMVDRLRQAGMRGISLTVDVTNYVMLELGQPLHAYDLSQLAEPIVVRRALAGQTLVTLDDVERKLHPQDLLITDSPNGHGSRILGLAGVMGGAYGEVTADTTAVVIEAAHFDPVTVARSARRHKLPTEAAKRFERAVDPCLAPVAAQRVVDLLVKYGHGQADDQAVFDYNATQLPAAVDLSVKEPERLIGMEIPREKIVDTLTQVGCEVVLAGDSLQVTPPSWRPDLVEAAHLVEEIARLLGYDQIPSVLPVARAGAGLTTAQKARRDIARSMAEHGLVEVLSYPFVGSIHDQMGLEADSKRRRMAKLANPLADDTPYLRAGLLETLLEVAKRNVSRGNKASIMEFGQVTLPQAYQNTPIPPLAVKPSSADLELIGSVLPKQPVYVAAVIAGPLAPGGALGKVPDATWADAIELARLVGNTVGVGMCVVQGNEELFHPGRCAVLSANAKVVGFAGEFHPQVLANLGLPARTVGFELNLDVLIDAVPSEAVQVWPVSTFPVAKEDFAIVVDEETPAGEVIDVLTTAGGDLVEKVELFDVFRGEQVGEGKKSLALAFQFRAADRTLSAEDIAQVRNRIIATAEKVLHAQLRS